jgi:hypothetical protein
MAMRPAPITHNNLTKKDFDAAWNDFAAEVKAESRRGPVLAFVYYTGHGMIRRNDPKDQTWIMHNNNHDDHTPIELKLGKLKLMSNVFLIAFLDCCRVPWAQ